MNGTTTIEGAMDLHKKLHESPNYHKIIPMRQDETKHQGEFTPRKNDIIHEALITNVSLGRTKKKSK